MDDKDRLQSETLAKLERTREELVEARRLHALENVAHNRVYLELERLHGAPLWPVVRSLLKTTRDGSEKARANLITYSGLFDPDWYLSTYSDVRKAGIDPACHYLRHGGTQGLDPSPRFSSSTYLSRNPKVAAAGINPLIHYLLNRES